MTGLRLVADDLTGALDSAAQFCRPGRTIPVYFGITAAEPGEDAAFNLASRDRSEAEAVRRSERSADVLAGAEPAFKKIDSLLRGHPAAELAALLNSGLFPTCVLAPAFPSQGRVTIGGKQMVADRSGNRASLPVDLAAELSARGFEVRCHAAPEQGRGRAGILLYDAASDEELGRVVASARELAGPVLWCGSAGLALALSGAAAPRVGAVPAPVLTVIGSGHFLSCTQVAVVRERWPEASVTLRSGTTEEAQRIMAALGRGHCLVTFAVPDGTEPAKAASLIERSIRKVLPSVPRPRTLVAAGGETLLAICGAVGITHLEVEGERSPGIPVSLLRGGAWDGVRVISKSGAFGAHEVLLDTIAAAL